jgi:chromosomal replication initiation ATPase DnaA
VSLAARQLVLDLPHLAAIGAEDLLVSRANEAAVEIVTQWPNWPQSAVLVVAPARAGKTHLGNVWRLRSGATRVEALALTETDVAAVKPGGAVLVENLHDGFADQRAAFHLLNLAREHKLSILLTSRMPAGELQVQLPDLRSRLRALPVVTIARPDESLLRAVLVKHFIDRQLQVEPHTVSYLALRMEQSMEAAATLVDALDRAAMASHRRVTRALAAEVLGALESGQAQA